MGSREEVKNSPGRRNIVPYTSSAAVQWIFSLSAVHTPSSTMGSQVRSSNPQELGQFQGGFELMM